jgi:hypothetical protein
MWSPPWIDRAFGAPDGLSLVQRAVADAPSARFTGQWNRPEIIRACAAAVEFRPSNAVKMARYFRIPFPAEIGGVMMDHSTIIIGPNGPKLVFWSITPGDPVGA